MKYVIALIFVIGLVYILVPGPTSIEDYKVIPNSLKSKDPIDEVSNGATYFTNYNRTEVTEFYRNEYRKSFFWGSILPPVTLNYPPQSAYQYIKDLEQSTFLEEYTYPLKSSIFVNGYSPAVDNIINNYGLYERIVVEGNQYTSKIAIRLYPVIVSVQLIVYIGIWICSFGIYVMFKKVVNE